MNTLADNNVHPITTEAYVGWTSTAQAAIIATKLDKLRLHAYVSSPTTAFGYADDRLIDFANGNPGLDVSIIYSAEPAFMQTWLESNSMLAAENTFTTDWVSGSTSWANNINLDGFTYFAFGFMPNIVLPIELSYFRGQATSEGVVLNWATAAEINASHFVIEHQDPISKEFKTIGTTQAQGQSESTITYAFTDSKPHNKLNYYRLKQIDLDGNFDYSNAISVAIEAQPTKLKLYPTIAQNVIHIESTATIEQLLIYNSTGQLIKAITPTQMPTQIDISDLNSGVYLLVNMSPYGMESVRFVKGS